MIAVDRNIFVSLATTNKVNQDIVTWVRVQINSFSITRHRKRKRNEEEGKSLIPRNLLNFQLTKTGLALRKCFSWAIFWLLPRRIELSNCILLASPQHFFRVELQLKLSEAIQKIPEQWKSMNRGHWRLVLNWMKSIIPVFTIYITEKIGSTPADWFTVGVARWSAYTPFFLKKIWN